MTRRTLSVPYAGSTGLSAVSLSTAPASSAWLASKSSARAFSAAGSSAFSRIGVIILDVPTLIG